MAMRRFLPRKDGTSIPPSSTSRTTVPLSGNLFDAAPSEVGGKEFVSCWSDAAVVDELFAVPLVGTPVVFLANSAAGTTCAAIGLGFAAAPAGEDGGTGATPASAISRLAPK